MNFKYIKTIPISQNEKQAYLIRNLACNYPLGNVKADLDGEYYFWPIAHAYDHFCLLEISFFITSLNGCKIITPGDNQVSDKYEF